MARFIYLPEHVEFLKINYPKMGVEDLRVAFNANFGLEKTRSEIKGVLSNKKITCGRKTGSIIKGRVRMCTPEQKELIAKWYKKLSRKDLTEKFNSEFGKNITVGQMTAFLKNHNIKSGRTGYYKEGLSPHNKGTKGLMKPNKTSFKKGQKAFNYKPIGTERINVEGYLEVKTEDPSTWRLKQRHVWEQNNGTIPKGYNVRFKDGDKLNCEPENLLLVTDSENMHLNQLGFGSAPPEVKDTLHLMAKVKSKISKIKKELK